MASLYVTEYASIGSQALGNAISAPKEPSTRCQVLAIGGSSVPSAVFSPSTRMVRLHTDAICSFKFGLQGAVATATDSRLAANQTEYFAVSLNNLIAVITNS